MCVPRIGSWLVFMRAVTCFSVADLKVSDIVTAGSNGLHRAARIERLVEPSPASVGSYLPSQLTVLIDLKRVYLRLDHFSAGVITYEPVK